MKLDSPMVPPIKKKVGSSCKQFSVKCENEMRDLEQSLSKYSEKFFLSFISIKRKSKYVTRNI